MPLFYVGISVMNCNIGLISSYVPLFYVGISAMNCNIGFDIELDALIVCGD